MEEEIIQLHRADGSLVDDLWLWFFTFHARTFLP